MLANRHTDGHTDKQANRPARDNTSCFLPRRSKNLKSVIPVFTELFKNKMGGAFIGPSCM